MLSNHELQVRHYWMLMGKALSEMPLSEFIDELETLALHAESPALRALCLRSAHRFDGNYRITVATPAAVAR